MAGLAALFFMGADTFEQALLATTIDPTRTAQRDTLVYKDALIATAAPPSAPLGGGRLRRDDRFVAAFAGDLVGLAEVPWRAFLSEAPSACCARLSGSFAVVVHDRQKQRVTVLTDRRGQHPLFYRFRENQLLVSTALPTFCRVDPAAARLDRRWLYEYLFFNFPVSDATWLAGVTRARGGLALEFDLRAGTLRETAWAPRLRPAEPLLARPRSFVRALEVFRERLPLHFDGAAGVACALTGGWDARTVLAFAPPQQRVQAYTYGVPGCSDIVGAQRVAHALSVPHRSILFDEGFVARLPFFMKQAVYLAPTMPKVTRSTLAYVYAALTGGGTDYPLTLSGVSLDMLFRGHAASPALVSSDVARVFRSGRAAVDRGFWSRVFGTETDDFERHVTGQMDRLHDELGPFESGGHHLLFLLYHVNPKYFAGEMEIASNYTTVRVPAWDAPVVDLSLAIRESTLSYSEYTRHRRGAIAEMMLQSYILTQAAPRFARLPVGQKRPDVMLMGGMARGAYRFYRGAERLLRRRLNGDAGQTGPLEDWDRWLNVVHRPVVDDLLFGTDALLRGHVGADFLVDVARTRNVHWLGKLLSVEMVLRLLRNGWNVA